MSIAKARLLSGWISKSKFSRIPNDYCACVMLNNIRTFNPYALLKPVLNKRFSVSLRIQRCRCCVASNIVQALSGLNDECVSLNFVFSWMSECKTSKYVSAVSSVRFTFAEISPNPSTNLYHLQNWMLFDNFIFNSPELIYEKV